MDNEVSDWLMFGAFGFIVFAYAVFYWQYTLPILVVVVILGVWCRNRYKRRRHHDRLRERAREQNDAYLRGRPSGLYGDHLPDDLGG
ncbi:hypothetical protein [Rhodococcoides kroppenstedtii]|uniref:hypothetical protein n=1 Tax=Rhodococcoides kroppenstedtii TaxID=293050 RepID=UPI001BDF04CD|nr:hypothetical protein [Rhodococcus kroppenstedtii]MBT1194037.1 hypothetical protein [Rhodococcus kroppenstedtii]